MPWSHGDNKWPLKQFLSTFDGVARVVDVGVGWGDIGRAVREVWPQVELLGIEVWQPYLERHDCRAAYDYIAVQDLRKVQDVFWAGVDWTLWIDGPEHLTREDALVEVARLRRLSRLGLVVGTPLGEAPQGAWEGNEAETHRSTWTEADWEALGADVIWTMAGEGACGLWWLPADGGER